MTVDEKYAGTTAISRLIYRIKNAFDFSTHVDDETIGYSQGADADSGELSVKLQETRAAMGLGNTLGALPVSCGGTGTTDGSIPSFYKELIVDKNSGNVSWNPNAGDTRFFFAQIGSMFVVQVVFSKYNLQQFQIPKSVFDAAGIDITKLDSYLDLGNDEDVECAIKVISTLGNETLMDEWLRMKVFNQGIRFTADNTTSDLSRSGMRFWSVPVFIHVNE